MTASAVNEYGGRVSDLNSLVSDLGISGAQTLLEILRVALVVNQNTGKIGHLFLYYNIDNYTKINTFEWKNPLWSSSRPSIR